MLPNCHLLIIGTVWPEPLSSAAGLRMLQLIRFFSTRCPRITFACDAHVTAHSDSLSDLELDKVSIAPNDSAFDRLLEKLQPSIVLFDRFMTEEKYGWRVASQCPQALRILDTEDLHCLRKARQLALKTGRPVQEVLLDSDVAKREIASIYRSDLSLIISPYELQLLSSVFQVDTQLLHYLPLLAAATGSDREPLPGYTERQHFVSIGNFLHEPNADAVLYLKETIWPLIRKLLPGAELHIYGAYTSEKAQTLHREKEGFLIKGRAESSADVISSSRILLAPLRFGAGIKGKLLEAMQYGTPSVTTSIGAEGMHGDLPWNGAVTDHPVEFAMNAVRLYQDQELWDQAQKRGFELVRQIYDGARQLSAFERRLDEVQEHLAAHRRANFTGAMLWHHSLASTKYMSRWIELKNKGV